MSLSELKIKESEISSYGVVAAPDKLTGSPQENKAVFDRLIKSIVAERFNELLRKCPHHMINDWEQIDIFFSVEISHAYSNSPTVFLRADQFMDKRCTVITGSNCHIVFFA